MSAYLLANTGKADIFIIEYIQSPCTGSVPSCTWTFCAKKMIYPPDVHVSGYAKSRKADGENKGQRLLALRYVEGSTVHEDCADEKEILAELQQV